MVHGVYWTTGHAIFERCTEHVRYIRLQQPDKLELTGHCLENRLFGVSSYPGPLKNSLVLGKGHIRIHSYPFKLGMGESGGECTPKGPAFSTKPLALP